MLPRTTSLSLIMITFFGIFSLVSPTAQAANGVTLYTPYTRISVPPGESIDYTIDIINDGNEIKNIPVSISGMPGGWNYILKSGGWNAKQISLLPGSRKSLSLKVEVPLKVNKGSYRFKVVAGGYTVLPLIVDVSEMGTYKTEFVAKQPNMEGRSNATFTFTASLKNRTADDQLYALKARAPRGWTVTFKAGYKQVTSVNVAANSDENISIDIKSPEQIAAGTYKIPVSASTSETAANTELEVVITGSYKMELTTPQGLLSTSITAGDEKRIELMLKNTGSSTLSDIKFDFTAPANWTVVFDPKTLNQLEPGNNARIFATIKADRKSIAGDYATNLVAKAPEATSQAAFRISVKTPMIWGWIGVFVIIMALGSVYYLFRKYGRR